MFKKIILSLVSILLLITISACGKNEEQVIEEVVINSYSNEEYPVLIPYSITDARSWHGKYTSKLDNMIIPKGLMDYSKKYFKVKDNYLQEGLLLSQDSIQMLQKRESSENPYSLNPALGSFQVTEAISVDSPYIVSDIVELDFISQDDGKTLNGISLAIILNSTITSTIDGVEQTYQISEDRLFTFGSTIGRKLERYMRTLTDVEATLPIYITLYSTNSSSSYVPGNFIGEGLFEGRSGQFTEINEKWVIIPSTEAQEMNGVLYSSVLSIKQSVNKFLPENVSFIGKAKFIDNKCTYLSINIDAQAKTYTEIYALSQYVNQIVAGLDDPDMEVVIDIASLEDTIFSIKKEANSTKYVVLDMS